jgi:hypothetical protein
MMQLLIFVGFVAESNYIQFDCVYRKSSIFFTAKNAAKISQLTDNHNFAGYNDLPIITTLQHVYLA